MARDGFASPHRFLPRAVVAAAVLAGSLDLLFAFSFWGAHGVGPVRILQSIAAGWLGRADAVAGGMATAMLGAASHYGIVLVMAWCYYRLARAWPVLVRRPWLCGALYGIVLFVAMTWVVVPLSAAGDGHLPRWQSSFALHIAGHMLLVGIPCALGARRALR